MLLWVAEKHRESVLRWEWQESYNRHVTAKGTDHVSLLVLPGQHPQSHCSQAAPAHILQALLLFPLCFEYTHGYLSYTQRGREKSVEPVWQYVNLICSHNENGFQTHQRARLVHACRHWLTWTDHRWWCISYLGWALGNLVYDLALCEILARNHGFKFFDGLQFTLSKTVFSVRSCLSL